MRGIVVAVVLGVLLAPARAGAVESPATDPFYVAPADLAEARPGTILRTRTVEVEIAGVERSADQLLYRTADALGRPVAGATTVLVGDGEAPAGGRNLVSLQDATNSADPTCHPSHQLQIGSENNRNLQAETALIARPLLAGGTTVVVPDHLGPNPQYIVKDMEGKATLDGIRAALRHEPAELSGRDTPVALVGYSGGAHGSASANELHPAYAPELNLVGVAAGGVPVADRATFDYIDGGVGTGVLIGVSIGIDRAFPSFGLQDLLNERGKALAKRFEKGCSSSVFGAPFTRLDDYTVVPDVIDLPRIAGIVRRNALGHATPVAPTFFYHGVTDELVWVEPVDDLVAAYCADGATMDYVRDPAGVEHIQALANFVPLAQAYIADRFAGRPAPRSCREPAAPSCERTLRLRVPAGTRKVVLRVDDSVIKVVRGKRIRRVRLALAGRSSRVTVRSKGRFGVRQRTRTVALCGG